MKFKDIKVGMKVEDGLLRGRVIEILKTRVKVQLDLGPIRTYDRAHCQFLEPTPSEAWKSANV